MIDAVNRGALTLEKLEAMTSVCSVGLDMIAVPGDTPATTIAGIIADEAAIGMINQKTTAVRLIPVIGKDVGDTVEFGGQKFMADQLEKVRILHRELKKAGRSANIQVDGGLDGTNVRDAASAGANCIVAGTSVFRSKDGIPAAIAGLHEAQEFLP